MVSQWCGEWTLQQQVSVPEQIPLPGQKSLGLPVLLII